MELNKKVYVKLLLDINMWYDKTKKAFDKMIKRFYTYIGKYKKKEHLLWLFLWQKLDYLL